MKIWNGLRFAAAIAVVCLAAGAQAQMTTVSASALGTSSNPLANGTIYWQPVNAAKAGTSGGQILGSARSATVTNGVFGLSLPDALAAAPNTCYRVTAIDNVSGATVLGAGFASNGFDIKDGGGYGCVQPTGGSWNFDAYTPTSTMPTIYTPVPGPAGPACSTGTGECDMTVPIVLPSDPAADMQAATKRYVDAQAANPSDATARANVTTLSAAVRSKSNRVDFLGDSLTIGNGSTTGAGDGWAWLLPLISKQQVFSFPEDNFGVAGQTCAYTLSTELPLLLAENPKPAYASILCGTNDIGGAVPPATTVSNIDSMVTQLKAAGIQPVLATIPPSNAHVTLARATNAAIQDYAAANFLPIVDFYSVLATTSGTFQTPYYADGTHPNAAGYRVMAEKWLSVMSPMISSGSVWLPTTTTDGINLVPQPLMQTCAGVWNALSYGTTPAASYTCTPDASVYGDWFNVTFTADGNSSHYWAIGQTYSGSAAMVSGHTYLITGRIKISGLEALNTAGNAWLSIMAGYDSGGGNWLNPFYHLGADCADCTFALKVTAASAYNVAPMLYFYSGSTSGTVNVSLAQVSVVDMTAQGWSDETPWTKVGLMNLPMGTQAVTPAASNNSTEVATTQYVDRAIAGVSSVSPTEANCVAGLLPYPCKAAHLGPTLYSGSSFQTFTLLSPTPAGSGAWEMCGSIGVTVAATAGTSIYITPHYVSDGQTMNSESIAWDNAPASQWSHAGTCVDFYADAGTAINAWLNFSGVTGTPSTRYWVVLKKLN